AQPSGTPKMASNPIPPVAKVILGVIRRTSNPGRKNHPDSATRTQPVTLSRTSSTTLAPAIAGATPCLTAKTARDPTPQTLPGIQRQDSDNSQIRIPAPPPIRCPKALTDKD